MTMAILLLSLAAVIFNLTLPIMAGIYIVGDLGGSTFLSVYGVSFYCIGNALSVPLGKPCMTRLSAVQLYLICLGLMLFFSWQCATSQDYFHFVVYRLLEGLASGPLYLIITGSLIPYISTPEKQAKLLPFLYIIFSFTPVLGASWGGWIAYANHWRALFLTNIPLCLFLILYMSYKFKEFHRPPEKPLFDSIGYFSFFIGILFIGSGLIMGQELDWFRSSLITFWLFVGSLTLIFFILYSLSASHPIIDFSLLKNFYFSFAMIQIALLFAIYFGMVVLLSLWLKLYVNYTPNWIAIIIGTMGFGAWVPIFLNYKRFDPRLPLIVSLIFFAISCFYTTYFNVEINFNRIAYSRFLAGIALMFFLPPLFQLSVQRYPQKLSESSNFFHVVRLISCGLGASLFVILWHRRQVFYYERLGENLTDFSQKTIDFLSRAQQFHVEGKKAYAQLNVFLTRQATALALDDCFYLMGWISVFLAILVFLTYFPMRLKPNIVAPKKLTHS
ncbi:MFS transporter [Legionella hackeliae]|uniref:Transporter, major facilitator family n=1 Tax=Legionella hackeliae TaxID=449 RepID=A0A0A8UQR3_LEGHA|nr:MFS transporter [Legionella hackeliae]KTD10372.1 multidrug resistance protein, MFS superfamily [Legionella hackeliae]CEK09871.1 Transporter, major facilitator family [Legionella hackeliae]STX49781.1 multidrug resistance protein, MFS superfamily [Legionella hackeliae]